MRGDEKLKKAKFFITYPNPSNPVATGSFCLGIQGAVRVVPFVWGDYNQISDMGEVFNLTTIVFLFREIRKK